MENIAQHWKILQNLDTDLANRVRSFLVFGERGEGLLVATKDGQGFLLGKMQFGWGESKIAFKPTPLDVIGLVQMAQSVTHIVLLNKRGEIYTMGQNINGQLGLGTVGHSLPKTLFSPQLVLSVHKFISVRCGNAHNLALTDDGKVLAWGRNISGQVGLDNGVSTGLSTGMNWTQSSSTLFLSSPHQITELGHHRVVAVECGGDHSLALTDQGEVYAWGWNRYGQLGNEIGLSMHTPTRIATSSPVKSMAAGFGHTLLLTQTGKVWACGWNGRGQLGLPTTTIEFSARLCMVSGLPLISQIASHSDTHFSIAMSSDKRCFVWGGLRDETIISTPRELPPFYSTVESALSFYSPYRNTSHSILVPVTPSSPTLSARMSRIFDNPKTNSDVQFVVDHKTIYAHQIILSNFSEYFARMFSDRLVNRKDRSIVKVITITDYSYQVFYPFLRFLYTDSLEVNRDLLPELYYLASQYHESDLQKLCLWQMRPALTSSTTPLTPIPAVSTIVYHIGLTHRNLIPEIIAFEQELV